MYMCVKHYIYIYIYTYIYIYIYTHVTNLVEIETGSNGASGLSRLVQLLYLYIYIERDI